MRKINLITPDDKIKGIKFDLSKPVSYEQAKRKGKILFHLYLCDGIETFIN